MVAGLLLGLVGCDGEERDTGSVEQEVVTWSAAQITYTPSHGSTAGNVQVALDEAAGRVERLEARAPVPGPAGPVGPAGSAGPAGP